MASDKRYTSADTQMARQVLGYKGEKEWVKNAQCGNSPLEGLDSLREGNIASQRRFIRKYCNNCIVARECLQDSIVSPHDPNGAAGRMTKHEINRIRAAAAVIAPKLYAISKKGRPSGRV